MKKSQKNMARGAFAVCAALLTVGILSLIGTVETVAASAMMLAASPVVLSNRGRFINQVAGIQGVTAGGTAIINFPTDRRYHRINLQCGSNGANDAVTDVIDSIKIIVNGIAVRDISPGNMLKIAIANGYIPKLGELPLFFTEPYVMGPNIAEPSDTLSWDLVGQSTFQIQLKIKTGLTTPTISGWMEFDYIRNTLPNGNLFLQPVSTHEHSLNLAAGKTSINTIPYNFPIRRLWFYGATAGNISELEIVQDGNKVFEATTEQLVQAYRQYGIKFSEDEFNLRTFAFAAGTSDATSTLTHPATLEALTFFDAAYIADPDGRWWKSLKIARDMVIKITSDSAQVVTVVTETLPGAFAS